MNTNIQTEMPLEAEYVGPNSVSRRSSIIIKTKPKDKASLNHAKEYAEAASIHGIKYIAEDERSLFER